MCPQGKMLDTPIYFSTIQPKSPHTGVLISISPLWSSGKSFWFGLPLVWQYRAFSDKNEAHNSEKIDNGEKKNFIFPPIMFA